MKKVLMMSLVLAVAAPCVLAQANKKAAAEKLPVNEGLQQRIESALTTQAIAASSSKERAGAVEVLAVLANIRSVLADNKEETPNLTLQSFVGLYEALVDALASNPEEAKLGNSFATNNEKLLRLLCAEIDRPIQTGFGKKIVISEYTSDRLDELHWMSSQLIDELYSFYNVLMKYGAAAQPEKIAVEETPAGKEVLDNLAAIRKNLAATTEEKPLMHLQAFLGLYDTLAKGFAANQDVADRFEAKDQQAVEALAAEIQKPIRVGWKNGQTITVREYILGHLQEANRAWMGPHGSDGANRLDVFYQLLPVNAH